MNSAVLNHLSQIDQTGLLAQLGIFVGLQQLRGLTEDSIDESFRCKIKFLERASCAPAREKRLKLDKLLPQSFDVPIHEQATSQSCLHHFLHRTLSSDGASEDTSTLEQRQGVT